MYAWQIYYQRNRRMLLRAAAAAVVGVGGLLTLMPTPHAGSAGAVAPGRLAPLLSPDRLESKAFVSQYLVALR